MCIRDRFNKTSLWKHFVEWDVKNSSFCFLKPRLICTLGSDAPLCLNASAKKHFQCCVICTSQHHSNLLVKKYCYWNTLVFFIIYFLLTKYWTWVYSIQYGFINQMSQILWHMRLQGRAHCCLDTCLQLFVMRPNDCIQQYWW